MILCVESCIGSEESGKGVKQEQQVLITEDAIRRLSNYPFQRDWID